MRGGVARSPSRRRAGRSRLTPRGTLRRVVLFVAACAACLALAGGYAAISIARSRAQVKGRTLSPAVVVPAPSAAASDSPLPPHVMPPIERPERGPSAVTLMFRHTELDKSFGALAIEAAGEGDRQAAPLQCDRLHFARGRGVCLTVDRTYTTNSLVVFDDRFAVTRRLPLAGLPSRARISPDGRLAATTVFVFGHSYGDADFSTETGIIDLVTGVRILPNLQDLEVTRGAARFYAIDFNVWGVTFAADSDRFYATLRTAGQTYLVEGSVSSRRLRVLRDNVECPSLSPDNTRIVFKKRVAYDPASLWRFHALDLATMLETPLAEVRSVDDQVEWLDDRRVLYGVPRAGAPAGVSDLWVVSSDGTGTPALYLEGAWSPAVQRF